MKLYLRRNDKNIEVNKTRGDEKLPYFSLFIVPEENGGDWIEVGAAWKTVSKASGKLGYNMKLKEGYSLISDKKVEEKLEEVKADDIPFD